MILPYLLVLNFFYIAAFDHLPNSIRLGLAGILGAGYFATAILAMATRVTPGLGLMFLGTFLVLLAWGLGPLADPFEPMRALSSMDAGIRFVVVFPAGIAILAFADKIPHRRVAQGIGATLIVAAIAAATHPFVSLSDSPELRLAPFTGTPQSEGKDGAPEGLHSSGYAVAIMCLIALALHQRKLIPAKHALILLAGSAFFTLGYQVRTSWVLLLVFAIVSFAAWVGRRGRDGTLVAMSSFTALLTCALLLLTVIACVDLGIDIVEFSSGRTGTYGERIEFISQRSLPALLLGSGPGSDLMYSSVWWWQPKDSHNDFLRTTIEGGLVALAGTLIYLVGIVVHSGRKSIPYVMAIVATSAISNALLGRAMIIPLLYTAIAITIAPAASRRPALPMAAGLQVWRGRQNGEPDASPAR